MRVLKEEEINFASGEKNIFSKAMNIVAGSVITGLVEGFAGFIVAGPAGFVVGFGHGALEGAGGVIIYEGAMGLTETLHPEFGIDK